MSTGELLKNLHAWAVNRFFDQRIVFHHIPKCGGTSVARTLRRSYILSQATVKPEETVKAFNTWQDAGREGAIGRVADLSELMLLYLLYCDVRCVAAHIPFSDVAFQTFSGRYAFVTVLREPVERFISNYYWSNSRPADQRRIDQPFEDFLETPEAVRLGSTYVRYFSGNPGRETFTSADTQAAIANLRRLDCVGFLDDIGSFESGLHRLTGRRVNVGNENVRGTSDKRLAIMSGALRDKVLEVCAADRQVWDSVQDLRQPR